MQNGTIQPRDLSPSLKAKVNKAATPGAAGTDGATGPEGPKGEKGEKGDAGATTAAPT